MTLPSDRTITRADLEGAWSLVSLENQLADQPWTSPGPAMGTLTYTPAGAVQVLILVLTTGTLPERFADDEVVGYAGRFEVRPDATIEHHIDICARPSWIGTTQVREVRLIGAELVLTTTRYRTSRGLRRSRLRWTRWTSGAGTC